MRLRPKLQHPLSAARLFHDERMGEAERGASGQKVINSRMRCAAARAAAALSALCISLRHSRSTASGGDSSRLFITGAAWASVSKAV
jgi:hypothetical protein